VLGGSGDYSLPPRYKGYTRELVEKWNAAAPKAPISFSGPSKYLDAVLPKLQSGKVVLPTSKSGATYNTYTTFWSENPRVKKLYRRLEHQLQAAESISAVASLNSSFEYPVDSLYHSWLLMLLNMDRNTLWGAAGGMVFEHPTSWDALDRFNKVEELSGGSIENAMTNLFGKGDAVGIFNPMNQTRTSPFLVKLPEGTSLAGAVCQADADGQTLCRLDLPSFGSVGVATVATSPQEAKKIDLPKTIETAFYTAKVDPKNGALASLILKSSGREMLARPVLIVAERGFDYHDTPERPNRQRLGDSSQGEWNIEVTQGPLATTVKSRGKFFGGGEMVQTIRFYADNPRIDFEVTTEEIPNQTVVIAEFPLSDTIEQTRRGIPYGFSHGTLGKPDANMPGQVKGMMPAIRWSDYAMAEGGGVAILDRGLPAREMTDNTPVIYLLNAYDIYMGYRNSWLSGKPKQKFQFALYAHDSDWDSARVPQRAWEYNCPPLIVQGVKPAAPKSFLQTSDNVIVEAFRREDEFIEIRLVECLGRLDKVKVKLDLPHQSLVKTDLLGGFAEVCGGGPHYSLPIRSQQILTLRFQTSESVPEIQPLLKWDSLVPSGKLPQLLKKIPDAKGHPPLGKEG
jgi:alpha-mannosidase